MHRTEVDAAVALFRKWKGKFEGGTTIMYSTLVKGFANEGRAKDAMDMWVEIRASGVQLNVVTYNTLINAQAPLAESVWGCVQGVGCAACGMCGAQLSAGAQRCLSARRSGTRLLQGRALGAVCFQCIGRWPSRGTLRLHEVFARCPLLGRAKVVLQSSLRPVTQVDR